MKELNPIGVGVMGFADVLIKLGINYDSQEALNFIDEIAKPYIEITNKLAPDSFYKRIIAPTGSLSLLADCSSSIEPIFDVTFERHLTVGVMEETRDLYKSKHVRTAHDVSPEWHLKVQAKWQEKLDGACSKTINLPNNASVDDVKNIYVNAWKAGVKGITIFRDGSKAGVLKKTEKKDKPKPKCSDESCHL
jgi:ribonucleoside-diphosphate reductase alpha chain